MKIIRKTGTTSEVMQIFIQDSSKTNGAGLTGLAFGTSGLSAYYKRNDQSSWTSISLVTMTPGTFTSGGFVESDATNAPGFYDFCPPNGVFTSGRSSIIMLKGAANMAPSTIEVDLDAQVDVTFWNGTVVATPATAGIPDVNVKNIDNDAASASGTVTFPNATLASTTNITAATGVDITKILGTAISTPATAGILDINVKNMNNVAATSITAINANQGTTQPINFTGTAGSALAKSDMVDIAGAAVSTSTAQIGVNAVNIGGTTQTGRDIGASVLLSSGTGTGQLKLASGYVAMTWADIAAPTTVVNLSGTTIATTQKVDVETIKTNPVVNAGTITFPTTATLASTTNITAGTITTATNLTNAATSGDFTATMKTSLNAATPASVTGNVGGNVVGSVGSVTAAVATTSNVKKNTSSSGFTFVMTNSTTHAPATGLTVTANRSIDGAAFGACANAVSELSNGWYLIDLAAADVNGNHIALRFSATAADDCNIQLTTQP